MVGSGALSLRVHDISAVRLYILFEALAVYSGFVTDVLFAHHQTSDGHPDDGRRRLFAHDGSR